MSYTLDPSKTVLLSLHMQHDIVLKEGKFGDFFGDQAEKRGVVSKGQQLLKTARTQDVPIMHVAVCFNEGHSNLQANSPLLSLVKQMDALVKGTWGGSFIEEVRPFTNETIIESQRVGPFEDTDLSSFIAESGADTVLLYGVATNFVVETAARVASDQGYNVIVVEDCCSAATPEAHQASLDTLGLLTTVTTLQEVEEKLTNKVK